MLASSLCAFRCDEIFIYNLKRNFVYTLKRSLNKRRTISGICIWKLKPELKGIQMNRNELKYLKNPLITKRSYSAQKT